MTFLPGCFDETWERRRARLLHEMQARPVEELDWFLPRRGGRGRLPDEFAGWRRNKRRGDGGDTRGRTPSDRSMRERFAALARGSQPAVVKLASYGTGTRLGPMIAYLTRGGELAVENQRGERLQDKEALRAIPPEWQHLFDERRASRDIGVFEVSVIAHSGKMQDGQDALIRDVLRGGFGTRRFVYAASPTPSGASLVNGVLVLRDDSGERLTGDAKAASIVAERFAATAIAGEVEAVFRFRGYGNGVAYGTARVRDLLDKNPSGVQDEAGRIIADRMRAGDLVQREWRRQLHSRKGRDVMHLVISARAGTDVTAFESSVRDFLGTQFASHQYVFAVHDPAADPKASGAGGKRPHVHAHAVVSMRSIDVGRLQTSPSVFRIWRTNMAEKARTHGIAMEMTDRREFASPPAYTRTQVRPTSYDGRTQHTGTSAAAQARYHAKRSNRPRLAGSDKSVSYAARAVSTWRELSLALASAAGFPLEQLDRIAEITKKTVQQSEIGQYTANLACNEPLHGLIHGASRGNEALMRDMTRSEFSSYERRVENLLSRFERSVRSEDKLTFKEIAAVAREIVSIRRERLELSERQAIATSFREGNNTLDGVRLAPEREWELANTGPAWTNRLTDELAWKADQAAGTDRIVQPQELPANAQEILAGIHRSFDAASQLFADRHDRHETDDFRRTVFSWLSERIDVERVAAIQQRAHNEAVRKFGPEAVEKGDTLLRAVEQSRALPVDAERHRSLDAALQDAAAEAVRGNGYLRERARQDSELQRAIDVADRAEARVAALALISDIEKAFASAARSIPDRWEAQHVEFGLSGNLTAQLYDRLEEGRTREYDERRALPEYDRAVASFGAEHVDAGLYLMIDLEDARQALTASSSGRLGAEQMARDLENALRSAAREALDGNGYLQDQALRDLDLRQAIADLRREQHERGLGFEADKGTMISPQVPPDDRQISEGHLPVSIADTRQASESGRSREAER